MGLGPKKSDRKGEREKLVSQANRDDERGQAPKATEVWRKLAESGDIEAAWVLGQRLEAGRGCIQNFGEATHWIRVAAEAEHVEAMAKLGEIYLTGRPAPLSVSADIAKFAEESEDGRAPPSLAAMFPYPIVIKRNPEEAAKWNREAALKFNVGALVRLGMQHASGVGVEQNFSDAEAWLEEAALEGSAAGQTALALLYIGSQLGSPDYARAVPWLEKAAEQGEVAAKFHLARLLSAGRGAPEDRRRAVLLWRDAAEGGHVEAMYMLGQALRFGHGVGVNSSEAETWLRRASARGHVRALVSVGALLIDQEIPDYLSAFQVFQEAAERGDAEAQLALASLLLQGKGVTRDPEEAVRWTQKAADQGHIVAYERLGALHGDGIGVEQDLGLALGLFERAAAEGSASALYNLGQAHAQGLETPKDPALAAECFREAAERGFAEAAVKLGLLYARGEGVDQSYENAALWYEKAASLGSKGGAWNLAFLKIRGLGVEKDIGAGIATLEFYAEDGDRDAVYALRELYAAGEYVPADPDRANYWIMRAAKLGSGWACRLLLTEIEEKKPDAMAVEDFLPLLQSAADAGEIDAQTALGRLYYHGELVAKDFDQALTHFGKAAHAGSAFAQAFMGDILYKGAENVVADEDAAVEWYRLAAQKGHAGAAVSLMACLERRGLSDNDRIEIFGIFERIAEKGDPLAQRMLGDFYLKGFGVEASKADAEVWLRKASEAANAAAQFLLAGMLLQGQARARGDKEPIDLLTKAAANGHVEAGYNLGVCFKRGIGVEPDLVQAERWYRSAAELHSASAKLALADLLWETAQTESRALEAAYWYEAAAASGVAAANFGLGRHYETGRGRDKNLTQAAKHYVKAFEAGIKEAIPALERIQAELTTARRT